MKESQRPPISARSGVALFVGYLLLFLVLHWPFRDPVVGVLGSLPGYLPAVLPLHPLSGLAALLHLRGTTVAQGALIVVGALLFTLYARCLLAARRAPETSNLRALLLWAALFGLPLLVTPYQFSSDVYSYIMYGRVASVYGANPAVVPPNTFPNDPFLGFLPFWRETPSVYGPIWNLIAAGLALLGSMLGGSAAVTVLVFKLAALGMHLACAALIWSIVARWRPGEQLWATLLYAWNPLALIETAGNGHNDVAMLLFLLLGIWLAQRDRWRTATVALAFAALAKYTAGLLLPVYAIYMMRRRPDWGRRLLVGAQMVGLALGCAVAFYAPFWAGGKALWWLTSDSILIQSINSPYMLFSKAAPRVLLRLHMAANPEQATLMADRFNSALSKLIMLTAAGVGCVALWRRPTFDRLIQVAFAIFLVSTLIALPWFWPWYVLWPLALAPFAQWRPAQLATLVFSAAALAIYLEIPPRPLYVFAPPFALLLFFGVRALRNRRASTDDRERAVPAAGKPARTVGG